MIGFWFPVDAEREPQKRRVRVLRISPDVLLAFFLSMHDRPRIYSAEGLPSDARVLRSAVDPMTGDFIVIVESDSFQEVSVGLMPAEIEIQLSEQYRGEAVR